MSKYRDWKRVTIYLKPNEIREMKMQLIDLNISASEFIRQILLVALNLRDTEVKAARQPAPKDIQVNTDGSYETIEESSEEETQ